MAGKQLDFEGKNVCIVCKNETAFLKYPVKDDAFINGIRRIKQAFKVAQNNHLYVCDGCIDLYKKKRAKFEQKFVLYVALGVVIMVVLVGFKFVFTGSFDFYQILVGLMLVAFLAALSLADYVPGLVGMESMIGQSPAAGVFSKVMAAPSMLARKQQLQPSKPAKAAARPAKKPAKKARKK